MSKIVDDKAFLINLRKLTILSKVIIAILSLLLISILFFCLFYNPLQDKIKVQKKLFSKLSSEKKLLMQKAKNHKIQVKKLNLLQKNFNKLVSKETNIKQNVTLLLEELNRSGLELISFKPEKNSKKTYKKKTFVLNAITDFGHLISFLKEIKHKKISVKFKNTNIKKREDGFILLISKISFMEFKT